MTKVASISEIIKVMNKNIKDVKTFYQKHPGADNNRLTYLETEAIESGTRERLRRMGLSQNTIDKVFKGSLYRIKKDQIDQVLKYGFVEIPFTEELYSRGDVTIDHEGNITGLLVNVDDLYEAGLIEDIQ